MTDVMAIKDAQRDAAALVASLYRNDVSAASLLLGFYSRPEQMADLCGALAAFSCACLKTIDNVRDHVLVSDGVVMPSGEEVLKSVMVRLAEPYADPAKS